MTKSSLDVSPRDKENIFKEKRRNSIWGESVSLVGLGVESKSQRENSVSEFPKLRGFAYGLNQPILLTCQGFWSQNPVYTLWRIPLNKTKIKPINQGQLSGPTERFSSSKFKCKLDKRKFHNLKLRVQIQIKATRTPRRRSYPETSLGSLLLTCAVRNACSLPCPKGLCGSPKSHTNHAGLLCVVLMPLRPLKVFFFFLIEWVF